MVFRLHFTFILITLLGASCNVSLPDEVATIYEDLPENVDYNFDIRPILSDRCYSCHGPDDQARKAHLRLDIEAEAKSALHSGNGKAIVNGNPRKSELVARILSDDVDYIMPTPESHLILDNREKALLVKWIEEGAKWADHWAFIPPQRQEIEMKVHPVDHFINKKIQEQHLKPNDPASKEQLIRRVSLDLTGLPPSMEEIDAFLTDQDPHAYENMVDQLLQSKACAERLAMDWMDVSRYADSHGMHADGYRRMWPWRDWVINAFDQNMPYDQFGIEQIAGDLLPNPTRNQILATAFNRNHTMTAEGGAIDEEFRLAYVFDRTETVFSAFQGLTLNCARCHDHKFDPISQKEYYELNAFFGNVKELGMTGDDGNYGPMLSLPTIAQEKELKKIDSLIALSENKTAISPSEAEKKKQWITSIDDKNLERVAYAKFESVRKRKPSDSKMKLVTDYGSYLSSHILDNNPRVISNFENTLDTGKIGLGIRLTGEYDEAYLLDVPNYEKYDAFSGSMWIKTSKKEDGKTQMLLCTSGEKNNYWRGWEFDLNDQNQLNLRLIHSLPHNYFHVRSVDSIPINQWTHVGFSYDGSEKAEGASIYINGQKVAKVIQFDNLYKSIIPVAFKGSSDKSEDEILESFDDQEAAYKRLNRSIRIGKSYRAYTGEYGVFKGILDEVQVFSKELGQAEMLLVSRLPLDENIFAQSDNSFPKTKRSGGSNLALTLKDLRKRRQHIIEKIPEIMVMEETKTSRPMYIYNRGDYTQPTSQVQANVPKVLPAFSDRFEQNRLGLAKWLFSPEHPLTARVTVNRYWQMIFGKGLVTTPGDFGLQGALPTHPELLDWLALDLIKNDWDIKHLLKVLVTSEAYKRSSTVRPNDYDLDPDNNFYARGASYRLPAEMIRDNALAASGLLVKQIGGASVRPYQPEGLWIEKSFFSQILLRYQQDHGNDLYRRSLYTFIRRTAPPPSMTVFDQPNREVCIMKRETTSTPLQALVLMNDPQYVESSRILAERIQIEGGTTIQDQLAYAFRLVLGRRAQPEELSILVDLYDEELAIFERDNKNANLLLSVGETKADLRLDPKSTAALAMVTNALFNHDEAYMKR